MSYSHPGLYRGLIWACAEFESNITTKTLHGLFGYADFRGCEAMLIKLRSRYETLNTMDRFDRPLKRRAHDELRRCETLFAAYTERVFDVYEGSTYH